MVNYYISVLAPTLYKNGHELLALKFQQRLKGINDVLQVMQSDVNDTAATPQNMTEIFQTFLPFTLNTLNKVMTAMKAPSGAYYT